MQISSFTAVSATVTDWDAVLQNKKKVLSYFELYFALGYCNAGMICYLPFVYSLFNKYVLNITETVENYVKIESVKFVSS